MATNFSAEQVQVLLGLAAGAKPTAATKAKGKGKAKKATTAAKPKAPKAPKAAGTGRRGRTPRAAYTLVPSSGDAAKDVAAASKVLQDAANKHRYIRVDDGVTGAAIQGRPTLTLSGAPAYLATHPQVVYVPAVRLVGLPATVRQVLTNSGFSQDQINSAMAGAYTAQNINTPQGQANWRQEVDLAANARRATPKKEAKLGLGNLQQVMQQLQQAQLTGQSVIVTAPRKAGAGGAAAAGATGGQRGGPRGMKGTLLDKLNDARASGKFLDVSKMTATGTGIKKVDRPPTGSKKIGVAGLEIVSSDVNTYAQAMQMLGAAAAGDQFLAAYRSMIGAPQQQVVQQVQQQPQILVQQQQVPQMVTMPVAVLPVQATLPVQARISRPASPRVSPRQLQTLQGVPRTLPIVQPSGSMVQLAPMPVGAPSLVPLPTLAAPRMGSPQRL